jgi:hypothetical protein
MAQLSSTSLFTDANLVSYYKLEDVSDSKGANTLTNTNTVAFNGGKFNNGADFTSTNTNKKLAVSSNLGIAGSGAMSISFWVKPYTVASAQTYIFHNSTTTADRYLAVSIDGSNHLTFNGAGASDSATTFTNTSSFSHIVVTRSGAGAVLGYLNGVQVASLSVGGSGVTTNELRIGVTAADGEYASCIIDDVAIFSDVLTAAEVLILFRDIGGVNLAAEI